jgi:hypothetical protein
MSIDSFKFNSNSAITAARAPFAVSPHDSNELAQIPKRLFIGTGGNVTLRGVDGTADVVYKNIASGVYLNVSPQYIRATGTTAADIVGEA